MPQDVHLAQLLFYSTKHAFLLAQTNIIHQAKFAINVIALAILVLEEQIQTASPV